MTLESPIAKDDLGIELQDRFGKRHWVPLLEVVQLVRVAMESPSRGEVEAVVAGSEA